VFSFFEPNSDDDEVLDLRAGDEDDELGLNENMATVGVGIAPVKVPVRTAIVEDTTPVIEEDVSGSAPVPLGEEFENQDQGEGESQLDETNPLDEAEPVQSSMDDEDDDEDEDKTPRSRFQSERNPVTVPANSGNNSTMGKPQPIRSLGNYRLQRSVQCGSVQ